MDTVYVLIMSILQAHVLIVILKKELSFKNANMPILMMVFGHTENNVIMATKLDQGA